MSLNQNASCRKINPLSARDQGERSLSFLPKRSTSRRNREVALAALSVALMVGSNVPRASAASGTFSNISGGIWSVPTNWTGSIVADGSGSLADFSTLNITADATVSLDSSRTIGQLKFGDVTQSNNWILDNGGVPTNVLTLNNGASQPTITITNGTGQIANISATIAGTNGFIKTGIGALRLSGSNTFSGQTVLNSSANTTGTDLYLSNNNALGTSLLYVDPAGPTNSGNNCRVLVDAGITIANNVQIHTSRALAGANGSLMTNGNVAGVTFTGTISIDGKANSGGHIVGPVDATYLAAPATANVITFTGPISLTPAYLAQSVLLAHSAGDGLILRAGNVRLSGGGSYFRAEMRSGAVQVGANNGVATNAELDIGGNANGNPLGFGILDLNGFNQTLVGIENTIQNTSVATVENSSITSPSTLTLTPVVPITTSDSITNAISSEQANLLFTANGSGTGTNASITDTGTVGAYLNLVVNGVAGGVQTLNTPNNSYHGTTTLTSGILSVNLLADGGSNSAIGASPGDATNLVFNGGTLRYNGAGNSTNRNFTINTGTVGTIDVSNGGATLTMSGGAIGGGGLNKAGSGTLLLSGSSAYTGATTVTAGTLLVNGSLASTSNVSVLSAATLGGTGPIGGVVTPASGGILSPGGFNNVATLTVGGLNLNSGSVINYEFTASNDQITVANSGGLTINGANLDLYVNGTTNTFFTNGTYTLFNVTGPVGGSINNLSIANAAASKTYTLVNTGTAIQLTIGDAPIFAWTNAAGTNLWTDAGDWTGGNIPNAKGQSASFAAQTGTNGNINMNGSKTVGGLTFNNSGVNYNIGGTGTLTLDNGSAATAVDVLSGIHTISVPVTQNSPVVLTATNVGDSLTMLGSITGGKSLTAVGNGSIVLGGNNAFSTLAISSVSVSVGTGGATGTLGSGATTITNGGSLTINSSANYNYGQAITGGLGSGSLNQIGAGTTTVGAISGLTTVNVSNGALVGTLIAQTNGINVTGTGSLTTSGAVSGAGKLTVNTTGSVALGAVDSYSGGTELDAGTINLGVTNSFPSATALAVNGGTFNLKGTNITASNFLDLITSTGVIQNNNASSTSTVNFAGFTANYNIYAALRDGPTGGKVALVSSIGNNTTTQDGLGNTYTLALHTAGNYSGGTTINSQSVIIDATNALGTGLVTLSQNLTSTNNMRLELVGGVTIPNAVTLIGGNPFTGYGSIQYITQAISNFTLNNTSPYVSGPAVINGAITVTADPASGGTFGGGVDSAADVLDLNGPITTSGSATNISVRGGNVGFGGGGSYPILNLFGTAIVNANNGIATGASVTFSGGTLDLNGNNQAVAFISVVATSGTILNSNTSSVTLPTLMVSPATNDFYAGGISGPLSLNKAGVGLLNLQVAPSYTGTTQVSAGTLTFSASTVGSGIRILSLPGAFNIAAGATATVAPSVASTDRTLLSIGSLTIAGASNAWTGKLDALNNDLDVVTGNITNVTNQLKQGFNGGQFNGTGGITSTTAANDTTHLTTLGAIQNSLNQSPAGTVFLSSFDGQTVTATDVLVKYTYYGDANLDGQVDGTDYSRIDSGYVAGATGWFNGDFNYDGFINGSDYTLIDNAFNMQGAQILAAIAQPTAEVAGGAGGSAVPEPTTLGLLALGSVGALGRRRRKM